jgi:hypothetical protein
MVPGGGLRPGNNTPLLPTDFSAGRIAELNALCVPSAAFAAARQGGGGTEGRFRAYAYL